MSPVLSRGPPGGPAGPSVDRVPVLEAEVGALVVLLGVTLLSGLLPLGITRRTCNLEPGVRHFLFSLLCCFGGGVFLATCLLDLLPVYLQGISRTFREAGITLQFPLPEFIVALGFILVLVLGQVILAFKEQAWSHQEDCRGPKEECRGLLVDQNLPVHGDSGSRSALRAFVLVFSLSLHSVLKGLGMGLLEAGLSEQGRGFIKACLVLMIHKSTLSFSLSVQLLRGRLRRPLVVICLLLFAAMAPLGMALGLSRNWASPRLRLACCTLEGFAVGTFSYITFMEVLPQDLAAARGRVPKVAALFGGFALVTTTLFIKP